MLEVELKRADLFRAGPFRRHLRAATSGCADSKHRLLDGIREATPSDFCADGVSDFLLPEVFRVLAHE